MTCVKTLSWCLAHSKVSRNHGDQTFWFGQDRLGLIVPSTIISCSCQALGWLMICSPYQQMTALQWITSYSPRFRVDVPKAFLREAGCGWRVWLPKECWPSVWVVQVNLSCLFLPSLVFSLLLPYVPVTPNNHSLLCFHLFHRLEGFVWNAFLLLSLSTRESLTSSYPVGPSYESHSLHRWAGCLSGPFS